MKIFKKYQYNNVKSLYDILEVLMSQSSDSQIRRIATEDISNRISDGYSITKYDKVISGEIANYLSLIGITKFIKRIDTNLIDDMDDIIQLVVNHNSLYKKMNKKYKFDDDQLLSILCSDPNEYFINTIEPSSHLMYKFLLRTGKYDVIDFSDLNTSDLISLIKYDKVLMTTDMIKEYEKFLPKLSCIPAYLDGISTHRLIKLMSKIAIIRFNKSLVGLTRYYGK